MLFWLLVPLKDYFIFFNVFRYITVRTALAGITALLLSLLLGPCMIKLLKKYQIGEEIRTDGPKSHTEKRGTPSMGGLLIISCTIVPTLLWCDLSNKYVCLAIFTMISFGLIEWDRGSLFNPPTSVFVTANVRLLDPGDGRQRDVVGEGRETHVECARLRWRRVRHAGSGQERAD